MMKYCFLCAALFATPLVAQTSEMGDDPLKPCRLAINAGDAVTVHFVKMLEADIEVSQQLVYFFNDFEDIFTEAVYGSSSTADFHQEQIETLVEQKTEKTGTASEAVVEYQKYSAKCRDVLDDLR